MQFERLLRVETVSHANWQSLRRVLCSKTRSPPAPSSSLVPWMARSRSFLAKRAFVIRRYRATTVLLQSLDRLDVACNFLVRGLPFSWISYGTKFIYKYWNEIPKSIFGGSVLFRGATPTLCILWNVFEPYGKLLGMRGWKNSDGEDGAHQSLQSNYY